MIQVRTAVCPCCAGYQLDPIGKLPDSQWFAGIRLEQKLSGGSLFRCRECKLKFRHPVQAARVYSELYDNAATSTWQTESRRRDWELAAEYIADEKPHGGQVLDFGCYTGGLLATLRSRYSCHGVEINRAVAAVASERIGSPVWRSLEEIPADLRFDAVIATDVIEHMTNPLEFIDRLGTVMANDGVLIITTGDADNPLWNRFGPNWWYCFYPEHVSFISEAWLEYAATTSGWSVARCEAFPYGDSGQPSSVGNKFLTYCYGWFPLTYLAVAGLAKQAVGRPGVNSVPGAGVSRDHLFIVLRKMGGV